MGSAQNQLVEKLKDAGNRLLEPPSSTDKLLNLLDEVELLLSMVGQSPPPLVEEALLPFMKALIADQLLKNSEVEVQITVAACLNELIRVTAPDAPYEDDKMKEIFELIVMSFDKLSCEPGRCYSKALAIVRTVARVRSCLIMLDLECNELIVKMFEQFQKIIRSDHPDAVFLAMEKIMSIIIDESEDISLELLRVLLASVRKENQNASPASLKLGAQVINKNSEKLKPYVMEAVESMEIDINEYDSVVASMCQNDPHVKNHVDDPGMQMVVKQAASDAAKPGDAAAKKARKDRMNEYISGKKNSSKALKHHNRIDKSDLRNSAEPGSRSGKNGNKKGKKMNSHSPDDRHAESRGSKGRESVATLQGRSRKSLTEVKSDVQRSLALGNIVPKEEIEDFSDEQFHQAPKGGDRDKKKLRPQKDTSGSGDKSLSRKIIAHSSKKDEAQMKESSKSISRRKKIPMPDDDEVFETPHGPKKYKEDLIGSRIKVWWPLDKRFYEGIVASFNASTMKHRVEYDDGDVEILNIREEVWEFVGDEDPPDDLSFLLDQKPGYQVSHPSIVVKQEQTLIEDDMETPKPTTVETKAHETGNDKSSPPCDGVAERSETPNANTDPKR